MGRSHETFGKKEVRSRKEKKRKSKELKRANKSIEGKKKSFNDMIAYVDERGQLSALPPDPNAKIDIPAESIELSVTKNTPGKENAFSKKGIIVFFNESRKFGFLRDTDSGQQYFFHVSSINGEIEENSTVTFNIGKGPKGISAINISPDK